MSITGYKIVCTSTSTNSNVIEGYKWEIEQNGAVRGYTEWINDSSGYTHTFFLENGGRFRVNFYIWWNTSDDSATKIGYIYPPTEEIEEPEPEPEVEYKYEDPFKETKPAIDNWLKDRNAGELLIMGFAVVFILLLLLFKRPKKKQYYIIRRKMK